jgi:hypothetical protein
MGVQRFGLVAFGGLLLAACSLFDHGTEWQGGPYELAWIDTYDAMSLYYRLDQNGGIGRVEATVFSVGWDGRYAVAKQHPKGNKSVTHYFYIDSQKDGPHADQTAAVTGPLGVIEYRRKAVELGLPEFTKTLKELE